MSYPVDEKQYVVRKDDGRDYLRSSENSLVFADGELEKSMNDFYLSSVPTTYARVHKVRRLRSSTSLRSLSDNNLIAELPPPMPQLPLGLQHSVNHFDATDVKSAGVVEGRSPSDASASLQRDNVFDTLDAKRSPIDNTTPIDITRSTSPYIESSTRSPLPSEVSAHSEKFHSGVLNVLYLPTRSSSIQQSSSIISAAPSRYASSPPPPPPPVPPRPRFTNQFNASSAPPMVSTFRSMPPLPVESNSPPPPLPARPEYLKAQGRDYYDSDEGIGDVVNGVQMMTMSSGGRSAFNKSLINNQRTRAPKFEAHQDLERERHNTENLQMDSSHRPLTILPSPRHTSLGQDHTHAEYNPAQLQIHAARPDVVNHKSGNHSYYPSSPVHHPARTYSEPAPNDFIANSHYGTHEPTMWNGQNQHYPQGYIPYSPPSAPPSYGYYNPQTQFESPPGSPPYLYYPPNQTYYPNMSPGAVYYPNSPSPYTPYMPPPPTEHKHNMGARIGKYLGKGMASLSGQILDDDVQNDLN